jgi:hypothetical protein
MIWETTREDIARLSYMKDPRKVALYLGVPVEVVEHVRGILKPPRKTHVGVERYGDGTKNGSTGLTAHLEFESDARTGSEMLKEGIQRLFADWEHEHVFKPGSGQILLPAGYVPERTREAA